MKCPSCRRRKAVINSQYGVTFCKQCRLEEERYQKPHWSTEFTTNNIRDERRAYAKDIIQPWDGEGTLSKEYLQEYGTQGIEATKEQIKNAKYTHKGIKGWWNRSKSKGGKHK